jgi:hypothetical protein
MFILQSKERYDMSKKTDKFVVFSKKFAGVWTRKDRIDWLQRRTGC